MDILHTMAPSGGQKMVIFLANNEFSGDFLTPHKSTTSKLTHLCKKIRVRSFRISCMILLADTELQMAWVNINCKHVLVTSALIKKEEGFMK